MRAAPSDKAFPWYDGQWLRQYAAAKAWPTTHRPEMLPHFLEAVRVLQTRPDFQVQRVAKVFDEDILTRIVERTRAFSVAQLELHQARNFGRFVVHDDPWFSELQQSFTGLVSDLAGEPVEPDTTS